MELNQSILVVDDEPKIIEIVKAYLEKSEFNVYTASTGQEALQIMEDKSIDLLILDLMLPDITGEEVCRKVREISAIPIIMMTAKSDEESVIQGLTIGADDYVTKPFSPRQLVARVSANLRRRKLEESLKNIVGSQELFIDLDKRLVVKKGKKIVLTPNEYKILVLLMSRPQKIFTRDEIIQSIMNEHFDGFDRTIDTHVKNLRQKIEEDPKSPEFILTVYGIGYRFGGGQ